MTDEQAISYGRRFGHALEVLSERLDFAIHELRTARRSQATGGAGNALSAVAAAWVKGIDDALRVLGPVDDANVKLKELLLEAAVGDRERELLIGRREASPAGRA